MRRPLLSVAEVDAILAAEGSRAPVVKVPLDKAAGRILREPLIADRPLPPFDRVMMDGFAVRWSAGADGAGFFRVAGRSDAGSPRGELPDDATAALEVMTGAVLPAGADTVIPYEETDYTTSAASFALAAPGAVEAGQFIHRTGSDFPAGTTLVAEGTRFGPVEAGIAASCGYAEVAVSQHPRIALISTGDELVPIGATPAPHQIRRSNAAALENALARAAFPVGVLRHLDDDAAAGREALKEILADTDCVIVTGAVSRGVRDWVAPALDDLGESLFHGVSQRPGKPMGVWRTAAGPIVFGLPGNPVSALVGLHRHVLPHLRRAAGYDPAGARVRLAADVAGRPHFTSFLAVTIDRDGLATVQPIHNSGDFAGLAGSSGLIELPPHPSLWKAGEWVSFFPWSQ